MFLMLSMLAGLGAVAIPVVVHLLHRQQTTPIQWGAMQFLIESPLKQKRRRNIEHWLLLLARMALLALLVFALARPLMNADLATPLGGGATTDFAVVIDHSLSTGRATVGGKTVYARAIETTNDIANSLKSTDSLTIILAEHTPKSLSERPLAANSADLAKLRDTLAHTKPGLTDAGLTEAVRAARDVLNRGRGVHKKIIILSDEQKLSWQTDNPAAWKSALADSTGQADRNVAVYDLPIAPDTSLANVAITSLEIQPPVISPNRAVEITASIATTGHLPAAPVNLWIDGKLIATSCSRTVPTTIKTPL